MYAYKDADGTIWAPARAEGPDGAIGDGMLPLRPGDPDYDDYDRILAMYGSEDESDEDEPETVKIDIRDDYPQKWRDDADAANAETP